MKGRGKVCKHVVAVLLQVRGAPVVEAEMIARTYERHLAVSQKTPLETRVGSTSTELGTFAKGVANQWQLAVLRQELKLRSGS